MFQSCCFKWSLEEGAYFSAIVTALTEIGIMVASLILYTVNQPLSYESHGLKKMYYYLIIISIILIICSLLLILGIYKEWSWLIIIWLSCYTVQICAFLVIFSAYFFVKEYTNGIAPLVLMIVLLIFWLVVFSYYVEDYGKDEERWKPPLPRVESIIHKIEPQPAPKKGWF